MSDMSYLSELDRVSYNFSAGERSCQPKNPESRLSVVAFLKVLDDVADLECIVQENTDGCLHNCVLKHAGTDAKASLKINYGGNNGYLAKVLLQTKDGQRQVSVQNGIDVAARKIMKYLRDPSTAERTTRIRKPQIDASFVQEVESALRGDIPLDLAEDF